MKMNNGTKKEYEKMKMKNYIKKKMKKTNEI